LFHSLVPRPSTEKGSRGLRAKDTPWPKRSPGRHTIASNDENESVLGAIATSSHSAPKRFSSAASWLGQAKAIGAAVWVRSVFEGYSSTLNLFVCLLDSQRKREV
jgi:hypothetical protein